MVKFAGTYFQHPKLMRVFNSTLSRPNLNQLLFHFILCHIVSFTNYMILLSGSWPRCGQGAKQSDTNTKRQTVFYFRTSSSCRSYRVVIFVTRPSRPLGQLVPIFFLLIEQRMSKELKKKTKVVRSDFRFDNEIMLSNGELSSSSYHMFMCKESSPAIFRMKNKKMLRATIQIKYDGQDPAYLMTLLVWARGTLHAFCRCGDTLAPRSSKDLPAI